MKKSAFTLIELLVVICVIAILAGIALPVFNRVTEKAHATGCLNNLRQLGIGTQAYLTDHEDILFKVNENWVQLLNTDPSTNAPGKYVPNWNTFKSNFDKVDRTGGAIPISYGINTNVLAPVSPTPGTFDGNVAKMEAPSQLILIAPAYSKPKVNDVPSFLGVATATVLLTPGGIANQSFGTHGGGKLINALFMDNHVTAIRFGPSTNTETFQDKTSPAGKKRWHPMPSTAP
jgi:prepilin-type N-terminal cleavage/methylation domain-containing protein/prepilin-type processing-associated H-X9-DG protein